MTAHHAADVASGAAYREPVTAVQQCLVEHRKAYLRYFRWRLNRPEDADDAFQELCLKALRCNGAPDDVPHAEIWLHCVMRSVLVDQYRRRAARRRGEEAYRLEPRETETDPSADGSPACQCVSAALARLRDDQADLIRRIDLNEEARATVAEDHGVTQNNLGVRLHRARQALKEAIADMCATCGDGRFSDCDC
ncbi:MULTISPECIES: sigma-70 family RNA polymerase sigma factor [Nitratireductor]|uniref:sigma-70 family RNA polymerase sigma factor n=1 Tax=Nitratireductor TaxID=245876 RepID=UPI000D0D900F|nr:MULTISPECIES: RNA polymerase sigma factor [Nitratireductor]PSM18494.1 RNA polymerase subunit sigma-70 [Nitratireductor sp. StC3]